MKTSVLTPQYKATDLSVKDRCITLTCSDIEAAESAKRDALAIGLTASTDKNLLILHYDEP